MTEPLPLLTEQVTGELTITELGLQTMVTWGGGTSFTETLRESVVQPVALQSWSTMLFGPAVAKLVLNPEPVPDAGLPPEANHERLSSLPAAVAEQVTCSLSFTVDGEQLKDATAGGGTAVGAGAPPPWEADVG